MRLNNADGPNIDALNIKYNLISWLEDLEVVLYLAIDGL